MEFFEDWEVLVGVINLGVALTFAEQETNLLQTLKFALDIAGILFDKLGKTPDMRLEVWVLGIDNDYLTPHA